MIEKELIEMTETRMELDKIENKLIPDLDKLCEQLGPDYHPGMFDQE